MAKRAIASNPFHQVDYTPTCSVCQRHTPHLFKGVRYCAEHHPDPGPHIKRRAA